MGFKYSTGYRNFMMNGGSFQRAIQNGALLLYNGTQPTNADTAVSGTLLCTITASSGARTAEVRSFATVTIAGSSGSVNSITATAAAVELLSPDQFSAAVPVSFNGTLTQTAVDVCTQINKGTWWHGYVGTSSVAIVTITKLPGFGDSLNAGDITATCTTLTTTDVDFSGGVDPANGLKFGTTASGGITKSGTWSGVNAADGAVTWCRFVGSVVDAGGASTTLIRIDMDVSTAGAVLTMSSTTLASGATTTIDSVALSHPAS
jgi:hypothetical protein